MQVEIDEIIGEIRVTQRGGGAQDSTVRAASLAMVDALERMQAAQARRAAATQGDDDGRGGIARQTAPGAGLGGGGGR